jgi:hypothetical protein
VVAKLVVDGQVLINNALFGSITTDQVNNIADGPRCRQDLPAVRERLRYCQHSLCTGHACVYWIRFDIKGSGVQSRRCGCRQ